MISGGSEIGSTGCRVKLMQVPFEKIKGNGKISRSGRARDRHGRGVIEGKYI